MRTLWLALLLVPPLAAQQADSVRRYPVTRTYVGDSVVEYRHITKTDTLWRTPTDTTPAPPPVPPATHVGPQVTTAKQWGDAFSGNLGKAGDTIWVRQGTYPGEAVVYAADRVLRCWPGERCTTGNLVVFGKNVRVWGFEVVGVRGRMGINDRAPGAKIINCVVRNAGMSGIGFWEEAVDGELAGNLVLNNGDSANFDHGIYGNGRNGTHLIRDNIVAGSRAYGIHLYADIFNGVLQYVERFTIRGNILFDQPSSYADIILASNRTVMAWLVVDSNLTKRRSTAEETANLGWAWGPAKHKDLTLRWNIWGGAVSYLNKWTTLDMTGNVSVGVPTAPSVVVRPNPYEPGRANVVLYNRARAATLAVDLSRVLKAGQGYELRKATDFYGTPVLKGSYAGPLQVPTQGAEFAVFVVVPR